MSSFWWFSVMSIDLLSCSSGWFSVMSSNLLCRQFHQMVKFHPYGQIYPCDPIDIHLESFDILSSIILSNYVITCHLTGPLISKFVDIAPISSMNSSWWPEVHTVQIQNQITSMCVVNHFIHVTCSLNKKDCSILTCIPRWKMTPIQNTWVSVSGWVSVSASECLSWLPCPALPFPSPPLHGLRTLMHLLVPHTRARAVRMVFRRFR